MDIRARHIIGTPEELDNLPAIIEDAEQTTLGQHDAAGASDWARAGRRDTITLAELYQELRQVLDAQQANLEGLDYFSAMYTYDHAVPKRIGTPEARPIPTLTDETKLGELRYRWIAVYPVTGGSEGHYVHVDLIWQRDYQEGRIPLFLAKTFGGHQEGVRIAGLLARVLGT